MRPNETGAPAASPGPGDAAPLEMWGGVECSHVRIAGEDRDQCAESGHWDRPGDLDLIASLGLAKLRYPLLWARAARLDGGFDLGPDAARFERLRTLGQVPIAGFLHHGWGPGGLDPLDPAFVPGLAAFAGAVAERLDWIEDFTPINEPVTTARFSYLYGHWHPHLQDESAFLRAVVNMAAATSAAMAAIRRRIPQARLIQTEDVGRTFAAPRLAYQAEYENLRRFIGLDLATGRVDRTHPFWPRLVAAGVAERTLDALRDAPCPPQVIGLDYYLTSDRLLDDVERYPGAPPGGNGRDVYVDVAAVHAPELQDEFGSLPRLRELHERYGLPLAITEAHNGCTREEQLRWLLEAWGAARAARDEGAQVVAVTSWALLGSRDWNSLMTARTGHYESGAFDQRRDSPSMTAVGRAVRALGRDGAYAHPLVEISGWWRTGAERVSGLPHLALAETGSQEVTARLVDCCRVRRIGLASGSRRAAAVIGEIGVVRDAGGALAFVYAKRGDAAGGLRVETPPGANFTWAANAFFDLIIDAETGVVQLESLGPDNQYVVKRVPNTEAEAHDEARTAAAQDEAFEARSARFARMQSDRTAGRGRLS